MICRRSRIKVLPKFSIRESSYVLDESNKKLISQLATNHKLTDVCDSLDVTSDSFEVPNKEKAKTKGIIFTGEYTKEDDDLNQTAYVNAVVNSNDFSSSISQSDLIITEEEGVDHLEEVVISEDASYEKTNADLTEALNVLIPSDNLNDCDSNGEVKNDNQEIKLQLQKNEKILFKETELPLFSLQNSKIRRKKRTTKTVSKEWHKEFKNRVINKSEFSRANLTMRDLLFYNPKSNPIVSSTLDKSSYISISGEIEEPESEQEDGNLQDKSVQSIQPVPQVRVGEDGQIIVDEESLVIERSDVNFSKCLEEKNIIIDNGQHYSYRVFKKRRSKNWTLKETTRFYKALSIIGTDFSLMESIFPGRTRQDLRNKYKNELRHNSNLIDKALKDSFYFDPSELDEKITLKVHRSVSKVRHRNINSKRKLWESDDEKSGKTKEVKNKPNNDVKKMLKTLSLKKKPKHINKISDLTFSLNHPVPKVNKKINGCKNLSVCNDRKFNRKVIKNKIDTNVENIISDGVAEHLKNNSTEVIEEDIVSFDSSLSNTINIVTNEKDFDVTNNENIVMLMTPTNINKEDILYVYLLDTPDRS